MQKMRNIQCTVDEKNEEKDQFDNFLGVNPLNLGIKNYPGLQTYTKQ